MKGLSDKPPYIAEPISETTYQNVMTGLKDYLSAEGSASIGGVDLGEDGWPTTYEDFVLTLNKYSNWPGPGAKYASDVAYGEAETDLAAYRVKLEYIRLTKEFRGEVLDDAERQVEAMDATREMIESWDDLQPAFPYSAQFIAIEGQFRRIMIFLYRYYPIIPNPLSPLNTEFKVSKSLETSSIGMLGETFLLCAIMDPLLCKYSTKNSTLSTAIPPFSLAIACVGVIVLFTVANVTVSAAHCCSLTMCPFDLLSI